MKLYAFELGRKKELCFAELIAVLGKENLVERNLDTAVFKLSSPANQDLQDRLGGTIKIVEVFDDLPANASDKALKKPIEERLVEEFTDSSGKIPFSISLLSYKNTRHINIKELLNFSKKILKSLGLNSRFVNKNFQNTKPSTIFKARVVEKGIDISIIKGQDKIYIGQTVSIQNIDNYSKRDFDKPNRDAKVGMLPPKLAQIMINLCGIKPGSTLFDPFCGTGTVAMEAMLMGHKALGSDISDRMVKYSQDNCQWLKENFRTPETSSRFFERDARFITKELLPEKIDAVVTEGYLGTPFTKTPSQEEMEVMLRELANLHLNWLRAVHKLLPAKCKVVMCVTAYREGKKLHHLPRFQEIASTAGYKILETYTYDRPDQIVVRDIKVLEKI